MKAIRQFRTSDAAYEAVEKLNAADIYSCISGCASVGYEILVRDSQELIARQTLGAVNEKDAAQELAPEVTK